MRRRLRRPATLFLRAGHRTKIFASEEGVQSLTFRAATLKGAPSGRVEVETGRSGATARQVLQLQSDNLIEYPCILGISIVPEQDTAITFGQAPVKWSAFYFAVGAVLVIGAMLWTLWEAIGGDPWP